MESYIKYPRTFHAPYSLGRSADDKINFNYRKDFDGKTVFAAIKMDGENTTCHRDKMFARSIDSNSHPSQDWVRTNVWARIRFDIPDGWRICGENVYAKHSIHYHNLKSYFYVFSIWNEKNEALSLADTKEWCELLDLEFVPVFYEGIFDEAKIHEAFETYKSTSPDEVEGYVVRLSDSFKYDDFSKSAFKYVRANHVQTDKHWKSSSIIPNELAKEV
jgi:hypothetical protein